MPQREPTASRLALQLLTVIEQAGGQIEEPRGAYTLRRSYAGQRQVAGGACTWTLNHPATLDTYMGGVPASTLVRGAVTLFRYGRDIWVDADRTARADAPSRPACYRWLTVGETYCYRAAPGKGLDARRGEACRVITVPRSGSTPANVLVEFTDGERHVVNSGVLKRTGPRE